MKKLFRSDLFWISILVLLSLVFRLVHFDQRLHFLGDQATSSLRAYEIWQEKEITLVGIPITSWEYQGHQARIGSTAYYFQLIPLLIGNFDPLWSSFAFSILAILSTIPLFFGVKKLSNLNVAVLVSGLYVLLPNFIDYSTFLWNPNTQLILAPLSIYFLGSYHLSKKWWQIGLAGFFLGLMLTLHFQFLLVVLGVLIIYFVTATKSKSYKGFCWLTAGLIVGFSPIILGEFSSSFYNTRTFWLIFQHWREVAAGKGDLPLYYFNTTILFTLLGSAMLFQNKIRFQLTGIVLSVLLIIDIYLYCPNHQQLWSYQDERAVSQLIRESNVSDFNVINLAYTDPLASVQKYLLATKQPDKYKQLESNYYENKELFIIAPNDEDLSKAINYEINTFSPTNIYSWPINDTFSLFLWERL